MTPLRSHTRIVAGVAGGLWTIKALVITAGDGSFEPVESPMFVAGLLGLLLAAVLVAIDLAAGHRGAARVASAAGVTVALVAATMLLTSVGQAAVGALAPGDNLGLEEEGGILLAGLLWLAVGVTGARVRLATRLAPAAR